MTFDECCKAISITCPNAYARAYAEAGIGMTGEAARVQALYILNNISHWRTAEAKKIRAFLKDFGKSN